MPASSMDRVLCRTPTPGKKPVRIEAWKYDVVRRAILKAIPKRSRGGIPFKGLPAKIKSNLMKEDIARLGSVSWYTTVVKLDLEVKGEIERIPDVRPQRLRRT